MNNYEKELNKLISNAVGSKLIFFYLSLLQDSCDYESGELNLKFKVTDERILKIVNFVKQTTMDLEEIISLDMEERINIDKNVKNYKKELLSIGEIFNSYLEEYKMLLFYMKAAETKIYIKNNDADNFDFEEFFEDCEDFLDTDDEIEEKSKISKIISYIPMSLTKERFFDYIREAFERYEEEFLEISLDKYIDVLKREFNPFLNKECVELFPEVSKLMREYIEKLQKELTEAEFEIFIEQANELNDTLFQIYEYLDNLFHDLNYISAILTTGIDMEYIAGTNPVYVDLYNTCKMILNSETSQEDKEIYTETLTELLNNHLGEVSDQKEAFDEKCIKKMEKYDDEEFEDEELESLRQLNDFLTNYEQQSLQSYLFEESLEDTPVSKEYLKQKIEELIEDLRVKMTQLSAKERKVCMQNFMGLITCPWDKDKLMDYLRVAMTVGSSVESRILAMNGIGNIMEEEGFFEHECDCDHDHHHNHECNCGHEHHHDHECSCGHHH